MPSRGAQTRLPRASCPQAAAREQTQKNEREQKLGTMLPTEDTHDYEEKEACWQNLAIMVFIEAVDRASSSNIVLMDSHDDLIVR